MNKTFIDFFSGIGGFRLGMEYSGFVCIGHCEIDKHANLTYKTMHKVKEGEWFEEDIDKVKPKSIPKASVWCVGFPCNDISVARSNGQGLKGSRSGLFYKVVKLLKEQREEDKPEKLIFENTENLIRTNGGWDFAEVLSNLDEAGYDAEWQIIDTAWYLPQRRRRIYIVAHLRGTCRRRVFPITREDQEAFRNHRERTAKFNLDIEPNKRVLAILTPNRLKKRQNGRRVKNEHEPMFTLTTQDNHGVVVIGSNNSLEPKEDTYIRHLTIKELFRLQGFPDEYYERAKTVCSKAQLRKQIGNAVSVPVVYHIATRLYFEGDVIN